MTIRLTHQVSPEHRDQRLDVVAAEVFSDYSRARLQAWIKSGQLRVNGEVAKPKDRLQGDEWLELDAEVEPEDRWQPQPLDLSLVYEDDHLLVLDKPAGLVVHPGAGVPDNTLLNGLLHQYPELAAIPRAGIVHRLDKETSGLMVVARSLPAHSALVKQLQKRTLGREYQAVVMGELTGGGTVDKPVGRHPTQRVKMAVLPNNPNAKQAITHYRLVQRFPRYTHILCKLETGRTHQIRVHMAHIHHPLVGDPLYLGRQRWLAGTSEPLKQALAAFPRQALHASRLILVHPQIKEEMSWSVPLPEDMQQLLAALAQEQDRHE